jgi:uncharacterized protein YggE
MGSTMPEEQIPETPKQKLKLNLSLDYKIVSVVLLAIVVLLLALWRPWSSAGASDRTISVTGKATLSAEPDEYVFYPNHQFKGADKDAALAELTKKSDTLTAELKKLGVPDSKIKTNSSGYGSPTIRQPEDGQTTDEITYTLTLTVTVDNRELAQKVQDYLVKTSPTGSVSPQAAFSDAKQKELEDRARDEATKDARAKADQSAENLGFKVGKVKEVSDGTGFGDVIPLGREGAASNATDSSKQLSIQPGENELNYSVTVVYYVK